jgi:DNA-binding protein H-NS
MARRPHTQRDEESAMSDTHTAIEEGGRSNVHFGVDLDHLSEDDVKELVQECLAYLSADNLTAVIEEATERKQAKQDTARQQLLERFRQEAAQAGISLESLFPHLAPVARTRRVSGNTIAPKYRGPNGEMWTGRGQPPRWLKVLMDGGHNKEEFRIEEGEQLPLA